MEFDNTFTVDAPIDEVWQAMLDVERVAPCVPGAQVTERSGDNAYKVAIKVKLGPVSMTYNGDVEIVEAAEAEHRAVMRARARESRGQGTADATVEMRLSEAGGATQGTIHTDVAISGRAAAMGQGVIADVSARLIDTFAKNLAEMLGGGPAAPPAPASAAAPPAGETPPPPPPSGEAAPPPRAAPPPSEDEGLPVLDILGSVAAERLKDPRALAGALVAAALLGFLVGRRGR